MNIKERLDKLNAAQQAAVTTIEGPVLVVAGPGTGKTEILSARVAQILQETDTSPSSILCLTYTEAGVVAMRNRLSQYLGAAAYSVGIYTYHAFCNEIIQDNLDYFGQFGWQPISDVENLEIIEEIIRSFGPDHPLARAFDKYEALRLKDLFSTLKRENLTLEKIQAAVSEYLKELPSREEFHYQRNTVKNKKGDLKEDDLAYEEEKMRNLLAAVSAYPLYLEKMRQRQRYDYDDMILWVIAAFAKKDRLLAQYQEKYLYVLVDEFQDTNGAQYQVVRDLVQYWGEMANLFVVGDDDQSIYRFQGANMENILDFHKRYEPTLSRVVLKENYRSTAPILAAAEALIARNDDRLVNRVALEKKLIASGGVQGEKPLVREFKNIRQEEAFIAAAIEEKFQRQEDLSQVAVIYREHRQVTNLIKVLEQKGIPLQVKVSTNVFTTPLIKKIITILQYIVEEFRYPYSQDALLFQILHYDFWGCSARDIALLTTANNKSTTVPKSLRLALTDFSRLFQLELTTADRLIAVGQKLNDWISALPNEQFLPLLEQILQEGAILDKVLQAPDNVWQLRLLSTFIDFAKNEAAKKTDLELGDFLNIITTMQKYGLSLPLNKVITASHGVNFLTAHGAKGLEFQTVYLMGCTRAVWDSANRGSRGYSFPDTLVLTNPAHLENEGRRLFYVALTRAKQHLFLSYAASSVEGKEWEKSRYVAELLESAVVDLRSEEISEQQILGFETALLLEARKQPTSLLDHDLLTELLTNFRLTPTGLNKFLTCPISFYFENILRIPALKTVSLAYGSCVHYALEQVYRDFLAQRGELVEQVGTYFVQAMQNERASFRLAEYNQKMEQGVAYLREYVRRNQAQWSDRVALEYNINLAVYHNVPIRGKLDRIEFLEQQQVRVIDYKTGRRDDKKFQVGKGDYWRQLAFYKLLVENDPRHQWVVREGVVDFVEPDKGEYVAQTLVITPEDVVLVGQQIEDVYGKIIRHEFQVGCGDSECLWCNFVKENPSIWAN